MLHWGVVPVGMPAQHWAAPQDALQPAVRLALGLPLCTTRLCSAPAPARAARALAPVPSLPLLPPALISQGTRAYDKNAVQTPLLPSTGGAPGDWAAGKARLPAPRAPRAPPHPSHTSLPSCPTLSP